MAHTVPKKHLRHLIKRLPAARILVVGDLILDEYIWGGVDRISPEAPVPVVQACRRSYVPGGAANVANNIRAMEGSVTVLGVVGNDSNGKLLTTHLKKEGVDVSGVIVDAGRCTTLKTRILAGHQQVVRVDWESTDLIGEQVMMGVTRFLKRHLRTFDAVIVEDYGKGLITPSLLDGIHGLRDQKQYIVVDPKEDHFEYYKNVTAITPNRKELENAIRYIKIKTPGHDLQVYSDKLKTMQDVIHAGKELRRHLNLETLLVTLGEQGMMLFARGQTTHIPATAQEVFDVSGAGDTVISVFTLALVAGASAHEAALLANSAAAIVVGKIGTATTSVAELAAAVHLL